jgi:hypothetical protein
MRALPSRTRNPWSKPVKKLKAIIGNPILLAVQGFAAGAIFIWVSPAPAEAAQLPTPAVVAEAQAAR